MSASLGSERTRLPVHEAFPARTFNCLCGALRVRHGAGAVTEIELGKVAAHVCRAHVVIGADQPAFEDREKVFCGIGMNAASLGKLAVRVKRGVVARELASDAVIKAGIVRHKHRRTVSVGNKRMADIRVIDVRYVEGTGCSATLH